MRFRSVNTTGHGSNISCIANVNAVTKYVIAITSVIGVTLQ